jgi:hypothetical protein
MSSATSARKHSHDTRQPSSCVARPSCRHVRRMSACAARALASSVDARTARPGSLALDEEDPTVSTGVPVTLFGHMCLIGWGR